MLSLDMELEKEDTPKRLKESEWVVISSLWERGEVTLKELSEKFKVSEAALSQGLKRRGIKRGAKAHLAYKETEVKIKEEKEKMVEEIFHFKKKFLRYGDFLMTLAMSEISEAKKEGKALFTKKPELDTIFAATKIYKTIRNDMFHLYDLYNPDSAPADNLEFNIGVYSEKEIEELREAQEILAKEFPSGEEEEDENQEEQ
jgi:hypothetical protein